MTNRELAYYNSIKRNPNHELFGKLFYITEAKNILPIINVTFRLDSAGNPVITENSSFNMFNNVYQNIQKNEKQDMSFDERYNEMSNTIANSSKFGNNSLFYTGIRVYENLSVDKS
ncbi:MAG TPA: hypothetical protein PKX92_03065 [Edaphocola sp.]|nr:hypothetical protein [Edaphocola sp.]